MGGFDQLEDQEANNNETSFVHNDEDNQEEIDFDQLLGDAAQSQVEDEEDRDDHDFDEEESEMQTGTHQTMDSLAFTASLVGPITKD